MPEFVDAATPGTGAAPFGVERLDLGWRKTWKQWPAMTWWAAACRTQDWVCRGVHRSGRKRLTRRARPLRISAKIPDMQAPFWICADGTPVRLSEMSNEHVRAVLRYLHAGDGDKGPMLRPGCSGFTNGEWLLLLAAELRRRAK